MSYFDWSKDKGVVIQPQDAVAVYLNEMNDIVIRRERAWDEDEDTFIVIPRRSARPFIEALERLLLPGGDDE